MPKLRLSSHQLLIETGRYSLNRTERAQRLFTLCDRSDVEDEYHLVIICPLYSHLRASNIRPYYYKKPLLLHVISVKIYCAYKKTSPIECKSSDCSGEAALLSRLIWAFACSLCIGYQYIHALWTFMYYYVYTLIGVNNVSLLCTSFKTNSSLF